jgi:hypothetical protein
LTLGAMLASMKWNILCIALQNKHRVPMVAKIGYFEVKHSIHKVVATLSASHVIFSTYTKMKYERNNNTFPDISQLTI